MTDFVYKMLVCTLNLIYVCKLALNSENMLASILGILLPVLFGVAGTWLSNKVNAGSLTGAEREQNAFNSQEAVAQRQWSAEQNAANNQFNAAEAQRNRDFQAEQAQHQMDFQERMDNTVYQRRVADMQAAGVNPALAIGGVSVGSTSGASASGSAASASPLSGASASGSGRGVPTSMSDIMQSALFNKNMDLLDSQIGMNDAKSARDLQEAGLIGEQATGQRLSNQWFVPMKQAELKNLLSDLDSKEVKRALDRQNIDESKARQALTLTQDIIAKADASIRDELNRASLRRTIAEAGLAAMNTRESEKRLARIDAEINELYQRAITESMQAGLYSAEELESFERAGLIRVQKEVTEMDKPIKQYAVDHRGVTYWIDTAQKTAGIVGSVVGGIAAGSFAGAWRKGKTGYGSSAGFSRPSYSNSKPFNAYYSKGSSLFTGYTQSW